MVKIYKSSALWDHKPALSELRSKINQDDDAVFRTLPENMLEIFLENYGCKISYNGSSDAPRYFSELLYYYGSGGEIITGTDHGELYLI